MSGEGFPAAADGNNDGNQSWNPSISLVRVQNVESAKRDDESQEGHYDDSHANAQVAICHGGKTLPANHHYDDAEASHGCQVEEHGDGDEVASFVNVMSEYENRN